MTNDKHLLIIGAGYLGGALLKESLNSGWQVVAARRNIPSIAITRADERVRWVSMDVFDHKSVEKEVSQLLNQSQIHAVVYAVSAGSPSVTAYEAAYKTGLETVLDVLQKYSCTAKFIFVSSTGVLHHNDGQWVDEDTEICPDLLTPSQREIVAGERLVWIQDHAAVARFSGIYGPSRTRLIAMARNLCSPWIVDTQAFTNRIHVKDGARALLQILEHSKGEALFHITDNDPAPQHDILMWLRNHMHLPKLIPQFQTNGNVMINAEMLPSSNKRIQNRKLRSTGFEFLFPTFREGYMSLC